VIESGKKQQIIPGIQGQVKTGRQGLSGSPIMKDRYITIQYAMEKLSCTERHIYDLIVAGKLEASKIGSRAVRISELSLLAFVEKNKINPEDFFDPDKEKKPTPQTTVVKSRWMNKK
jgi:excisionase family DNA binding protein